MVCVSEWSSRVAVEEVVVESGWLYVSGHWHRSRSPPRHLGVACLPATRRQIDKRAIACCISPLFSVLFVTGTDLSRDSMASRASMGIRGRTNRAALHRGKASHATARTIHCQSFLAPPQLTQTGPNLYELAWVTSRGPHPNSRMREHMVVHQRHIGTPPKVVHASLR
ncbi:hypothetical protein BDV95DRAFT_239780 [Massariosphaeria phaeospora]|uniref:Uncharacterized protein n=1 Tax=Massariosphaeria phaeospora TaxID=100035 RepID=A0A7C8HZ46_9PLEO|nr:hypothetical protein BDV95DRAFT_239780 [Massariosphaeria phaeospora]